MRDSDTLSYLSVDPLGVPYLPLPSRRAQNGAYSMSIISTNASTNLTGSIFKQLGIYFREWQWSNFCRFLSYGKYDYLMQVLLGWKMEAALSENQSDHMPVQTN